MKLEKEFIPTVFTFEMSDTPQKYIYSQEEKKQNIRRNRDSERNIISF